jgi:hypothetical protein
MKDALGRVTRPKAPRASGKRAPGGAPKRQAAAPAQRGGKGAPKVAKRGR